MEYSVQKAGGRHATFIYPRHTIKFHIQYSIHVYYDGAKYIDSYGRENTDVLQH